MTKQTKEIIRFIKKEFKYYSRRIESETDTNKINILAGKIAMLISLNDFINGNE